MKNLIKLKSCLYLLSPFFIGCDASKEVSESEKPNVIFILADDLGFSDLGCYGSEISTPNLDMLAEQGIRFTQAYNQGVCFPSRAAFLTGAYAHQVGMIDGPRDITGAITLGNIFRMADYTTLWSGKHHGTQSPLELGFDEYYGLRDGCCNYFNPGNQRPGEGKPARKEGNYPRKWIKDRILYAPYTPEYSDFYTTDYFTNYALRWLDEYNNEDKPFFLYLAYTAPHDPLHAFPEDTEKYLGKYMVGYEEIRKRRFEKQKINGLLGDNYQLSNETIVDGYQLTSDTHKIWDSLSEEEKLTEDSTMAVYAAMIDRMDRNIGRVIDKLRELGKLENTLIFFASDNGAAHQVVTMDDSGPIGSITRWKSLGPHWASVSNTPLRYSKVYSHEGGIRTPLIAFWPDGIEGEGRTFDTPVHFIDFMPTFTELAEVTYPGTFNDESIVPMQGISLVPVFKGQVLSRENPLFHQLNRGKALRQENYKIVTWNYKDPYVDDWELYDINTDPVEMNDLRHEKPFVLQRLKDKHDNWMMK